MDGRKMQVHEGETGNIDKTSGGWTKSLSGLP